MHRTIFGHSSVVSFSLSMAGSFIFDITSLQIITSGFVNNENVIGYQQNRSKYIKKWKGRDFNKAIIEMDLLIASGEVFLYNRKCSYAQFPFFFLKLLLISQSMELQTANLAIETIKIKTEEVIEECLGIKKEPVDGYNNSYSDNSLQLVDQENSKLKAEKERLNANSLALNSDFQKQISEMNEKIRALEGKSDHKDKELAIANSKIGSLICVIKSKDEELNKIIEELAVKKETYNKNIDKVMKEKLELMAQIKQLKRISYSIEHIERKSQGDKQDENVFEVEKLLNDKIVGKQRHYLVRWVGYAEEHDSWEAGKNLQCPDLVRAYNLEKQQKKI